jgi:tetratricopeptide (TPR) repeat protein
MRKKTGNLELAMKASGLDSSDIPRIFYLFSRQFDKLIECIKKEDYQVTFANNFHPKHHELAHAYFFKGDTAMSRIYADSAIQLLEKMLVENPRDHRLQAPLSKCYAFLGDREKAIEYGKKSISAMPVEHDAIRGIGRKTELLKTYALLGENDLALNQIEYLLSVPGWLTYGDLWTRPEYYALRDHPRFQKIIAQGKDLQISLTAGLNNQ